MLGLIAAAVGMPAAILTDVLASRAGRSSAAAYALSFAIGLVTTLIVAFAVARDPWALGIATLSYAAWWFIALNVIQAMQSSLRVQILREVRRSGDRLPTEDLLARYNDASLLELRLRRLQDSGAVRTRDGRLYVASAELRCLALLFTTLKRLYTGRTSEFGPAG